MYIDGRAPDVRKPAGSAAATAPTPNTLISLERFLGLNAHTRSRAQGTGELRRAIQYEPKENALYSHRRRGREERGERHLGCRLQPAKGTCQWVVAEPKSVRSLGRKRRGGSRREEGKEARRMERATHQLSSSHLAEPSMQ